MANHPQVVISDYPADEVLENILKNVQANVHSEKLSVVTVSGHIWGDIKDDLSLSKQHHFDIIFAADCFWMPWEHLRLAKSMLHFLSQKPEARVYAVAGFHTGRANLAPFFDNARGEGLEVESIQEVDVVGRVREWAVQRDAGREDVSERKRWLVVAVLRRA